jgi:MFS family permease
MYYLLILCKGYIKNLRGLSLLAWQGILISLLDSICLSVFYFLPTYFVKNLHYSIEDAGTIISSYGVGAIIGSYLGGKIADKVSPAKLTIFFLLLQSLAFFILIKLTWINGVRVDAFILGIAGYGFITVNTLNILNCCREEEQLKALNWLSTVANLGLGISALFIGFYDEIGFKNLFLIFSSILFLTSLVLFMKYLMFSEAPLKKQSTNQLYPPHFAHKKNMYLNLFIMITVFFCGVIISQMSSTYSVYIQSAFPQKGVKAFSILFAINTAFVIFFEVQIGAICKSYNKVLMMGLGGFFLGFGMLLLIFKINFFEAVIACIIYTIGEILFFCMAQMLCYKNTKKKKGHRLGMFRTIYALSRVFGPALGCGIYYHYNGSLVWDMCMGIGVLCLLGSLYFKKYYQV